MGEGIAARQFAEGLAFAHGKGVSEAKSAKTPLTCVAFAVT